MVNKYLALVVSCIGLSGSMIAMMVERQGYEEDILNMPLEEIFERSRAKFEEEEDFPEAYKAVRDYLESESMTKEEIEDKLNDLDKDQLSKATKDGRTILDLLAENLQENLKVKEIFKYLFGRLGLDEMRMLLEKTNTQGDTELHKAARLGHLAFLQAAFTSKDLITDPNKINNFGETPLFLAANMDRAAVVELLVENGANVCAETSNGMTPLLASFEYRELFDTTRYLLEQPNIDSCIKNTDSEGNTALHRAVFALAPDDIIRALLSKTAIRDIANDAGQSPLEYAHDLAINARDEDEMRERRAFEERFISLLGEAHE